MRKIWKYAGGVAAFAAGGAASLWGLSQSLFTRTLKRGKTPPTGMQLDPGDDCFERMNKEGRAWGAAHREQCTRVTISSEGTEMVGYYYKQDSSQSVILVHGFCGSYLDRLCNADLYYEKGYNVLAVDCRGHGESGGAYRTMGYLDGRDVVNWAKYLVEKQNQDFIILDGVSMGGAAVLTASGDEELPGEVQGIVSDCSFSSIREIFEHQMRTILNIPTFPFLNVVEWLCKRKAQISFKDNTPLECVKRAQVPVLFIHGTKDDYVPYEMGVHLNNACSSLKKLLPVIGAGHAQSYAVNPELYNGTIAQFLETLEL